MSKVEFIFNQQPAFPFAETEPYVSWRDDDYRFFREPNHEYRPLTDGELYFTVFTYLAMAGIMTFPYLFTNSSEIE